MSIPSAESRPETPARDFIREIVAQDLLSGRKGTDIVTRFPPEPNGLLHIGHAKSICIDFGIASEFGGHCNLRFDDTNPVKEEQEYVDRSCDDIHWLGFDWGRTCTMRRTTSSSCTSGRSSSSRNGKAYVDDLTADQIREHRGTLTEPGKDSPYRNRTVEENLDLFRRMRAGEFPDGAQCCARKIDMASRQHEHARSGDVPHPAQRRITAPATRGASIRCTTGRTGRAIRSRASRIRSARWSSRIIGRCTTGSRAARHCRSHGRVRSSSRGST